ncbi:MAG: hypothetical protein ACRDCH_01110, partial [Metamycoplasmataceae bacterium]
GISTFDTVDAATLRSLATLRKAFNFDSSVTQAQMDSWVTVTFNENGDNDSITLTAKPGFIINNGDRSIQSVTFARLQGITGVSPRTAQLAQLFLTDINEANLQSHKTLNNYFRGLTDQAMINNNMIAIRSGGPNAGPYTITLRANDGKVFPGNVKEITSISFNVNTTGILTTVPRTSLSDTPTANDLLPANLNTVSTLTKLFSSFNAATLNLVTATVEGTGSNTQVRLTTKDPGFTFANGTRTIISIAFTPRP